MAKAKKPSAKPKSAKKRTKLGLALFYDGLKRDPVPTTRITREFINNKSKERVVAFKYDGENVAVSLDKDRNVVLNVMFVNGAQPKEYSGEELPEIFRTRMAYYLSNLGWDLKLLRAVHEAKGGEFFSKLEEGEPIQGDINVVCGWRGVLFYFTRGNVAYIHVFYPETGEIERHGVESPHLADDLCTMLSDGLCFDCKSKIGRGTFCANHPHVYRSYGS